MTWLRGTATFSADRAYRYVLTRRWGDGPVMTFIGLNPSAADANTDDPTVRRLVGFARREGCGSVCVVNLFALRATDSRALRASPDPVGPGNDGFLRERTRAAYVVAAWGAHGSLNGRSAEVRALLADVPLLCFARTASGEPRHPLYVRSDAPLVPLVRLFLPGFPVHNPGPQRAFLGRSCGPGPRLPARTWRPLPMSNSSLQRPGATDELEAAI